VLCEQHLIPARLASVKTHAPCYGWMPSSGCPLTVCYWLPRFLAADQSGALVGWCKESARSRCPVVARPRGRPRPAGVGAAGYAVVWKNGESWKGIKAHMGHSQEAYDAECAALARTLESASRRNTIPERVTIVTDAQAAIRRMGSDEPGLGQQYALQARKHIAALRSASPGIIIEIRWCPAHKGIAGNEKADEWAKIAAKKPDTHGVQWLNYDYDGRTEVRVMPLPRSLANLKREISENKWAEARRWAGGRTSKAKHRMPKSQKSDGTVAGSTKWLASRLYQLKTGHCLSGQYLNWTKNRPTP